MPQTQIRIVLRDHPRLAFEDASQVAGSFLERRISTLMPEYEAKFLRVGVDALDLAAEENPVDIPTVVLSLLNPLLDTDLTRRMIQLCSSTGDPVEAAGAVPGTEPVVVVPSGARRNAARARRIQWQSQRKYGTQVNLGRLKRWKLFRALLRRFPDLHAWQVPQLLDYCGTPAGVEFLLCYGEDIGLERYTECPLCKTHSEDCSPLHCDNGHPVMGFFTRESTYYQHCTNCSLVFQNPVARKQDLHRYYDIYETEEPFAPAIASVHAELSIRNTSHYLNYKALLDSHGSQLRNGARILDLGGGRGEFCVYAKMTRPDLNVTLLDFDVKEPVRRSLEAHGIASGAHDLTALDLPHESFDAITMWEVIEHLRAEDLAPLLQRIRRALAPRGIFCLSTPDFHDPYAMALDFWAAAPGHHVTVLSRAVLEPLLSEAGLTIIAEHHECVTMKLPDRWFAYGAACHSSMSARAEASIIESVLRNEVLAAAHRDRMRSNGLGSELILVAMRSS